MDKRFLGILAVIIAIFVGIALFTGGSKNNSSGSSNSGSQATNHVKGDGSSGVKLVEYGDYQCSVCYGYEPIVEQIVKDYSSKIYFQFRNLPLSPLPHPNAFAAARAAEAAALQGSDKFWAMHDTLYQNQDPNGQSGWVVSKDPLNQYFAGFAQQIGLDVNKFKTDYASDTVNNSINADLNAFNKLGHDKATPTFFLDDQFISLDQLTDSNHVPQAAKFTALLDAEIAKKSSNH